MEKENPIGNALKHAPKSINAIDSSIDNIKLLYGINNDNLDRPLTIILLKMLTVCINEQRALDVECLRKQGIDIVIDE